MSWRMEMIKTATDIPNCHDTGCGDPGANGDREHTGIRVGDSELTNHTTPRHFSAHTASQIGVAVALHRSEM